MSYYIGLDTPLVLPELSITIGELDVQVEAVDEVEVEIEEIPEVKVQIECET